MTDGINIVPAKGLSTQRQVDSLYSAPKYFSVDQIKRAAIATGITVEYTIHTNTDADDPKNSNLPDERVVLIMGYSGPKEAWAPAVDMLLENWNVQERKKNLQILSFDNRGCGNSDAPWWRYTTSEMAADTLALMDHIGWNAAHVVGISMGGMISLEIASIAPQRVQSMTLIVSTRGKYAATKRAEALMVGMIFARDPLAQAKYAVALLYSDESLAHCLSDTGENVGDVLLTFHEFAAKSPKSGSIMGLLGQLFAVKTHFVSDERLRAIQKVGFPILIVGCMKDILIPPEESMVLKKIMDADHVHTLFLEHGGHGISLQYVQEVADAIIQTVARASS